MITILTYGFRNVQDGNEMTLTLITLISQINNVLGASHVRASWSVNTAERAQVKDPGDRIDRAHHAAGTTAVNSNP